MVKISGSHTLKNYRVSCMNDRNVQFFAIGSKDAANY
jgi:hypothetical protein